MKNNQWEICVANHSVEWEWFGQNFNADEVRQIVAHRLGRWDFTLRIACAL